MGIGIAVDGGIVGARDVARAGDRFGENAARRHDQRHGFRPYDAVDPGAQDGDRLVMTEALAVGQKAIVDQPALNHSPASTKASAR
jgi:hypothetical protein